MCGGKEFFALELTKRFPEFRREAVRLGMAAADLIKHDWGRS
jgi:hypothetical protein